MGDGVSERRIVDVFRRLIEINSPSFREGEIGDFLSQSLKALGCEVERQAFGNTFNLIARMKGSVAARPFMVSAHMDTIEPTEGIQYVVRNGVIRSTGDTVLGADDKSAIAQIIEALTVLRENRLPHGDVEILFTAAEEQGLWGAKNLDFERLRSGYALVLDSSGSVGRIVIAAPSHRTYEMRVRGRSAHAGIEPEKGISAIRAAGAIVAALPEGRIDEDTTANVGIIEGGTATNVVPRETIIRGEVRSHSDKTLREVESRISRIAHETARNLGARVVIKGHEEYRSFSFDPDDVFVGFLRDVYRSCGMRPSLVKTGGGSDANILNRHGIRALNVSTGMKKVHSHREQISVADLRRGASVVLRAIADFAGFTQD